MSTELLNATLDDGPRFGDIEVRKNAAPPASRAELIGTMRTM
jgi:hypothetical protein